QVQRGAVTNSGQLAAMLQQTQERSNRRIAWIQIRSGDGATVSESNSAATLAFSSQYVRSHISARQPIFKLLNIATGHILVEVFPFRLPGSTSRGEIPVPATPARIPRQFGTSEIAAYLDGASAALWPLKRNLMINSSAALVLLISLTVIALSLRS